MEKTARHARPFFGITIVFISFAINVKIVIAFVVQII